ncbi:MAG: PCMD domain-containing protein [Muribaculaceae bacterium]|nr:PCMD domain-containing protein [Muribaculaceae bacterium]
MKKCRFNLSLIASALLLASMAQSCVSDMPFNDGEGEGTLRLQLTVNSELTRAEVNDEDLRSKCVVYVSGQAGLLYKYEGLGEVPEAIKLKSGRYVAEAWTGDSVTASFNDRFFRGYKSFNVESMGSTSVVLTCRIANVVVSINPESLAGVPLEDWTLTVGNSRGTLDFTEANMDYAKGYYMMPNADIATDAQGARIPDDEGFYCYKPLSYTLEGVSDTGVPIKTQGTIAGSDNLTHHAHEYVLNFKYDPTAEAIGGRVVTIEVDDKEILVEEEIGLYSRPAIKGVTFEIDKQLVGSEKLFDDNIIKVSAFKSITELVLTSPDYQAFGLDADGVNLIDAVDGVQQGLKTLGYDWDYLYNNERNLATSFITLKKELLNTLPERNEEYRLNIFVKDGYGRTNEAVVRIAVGEGAVIEDDPITVTDIPRNDLFLVAARHATVSGTIVDGDATGLKVLYRPAGTSEAWNEVAVTPTRGTSFSVQLTGLQPGTRYEYKAATDAWTGTDVHYFTTEEPFLIPEADMETWGVYNKANFPGSDYSNNFWDSGNHGGAGFGIVLTEKSTDMHASGSYSAKLRSQFAGLGNTLGKFAAGNLFVGKFGKTVGGTKGAALDFGQPYNGSHPDALQVYAYYRPAQVGYTSTSVPNMSKNDMDWGQIFVAFATKAQAINTAEGIYFNPDDESILGYGEAPWGKGESFGADGLEKLTIPINWYDRAKTTEAKYLIIVCSASKYGDYFVGGAGSIMYVDDFELVYNEK